MKIKFPLIGLLFFIISLQSFSQYYDTGQDPASLKWKQIETEHFTIIFPESFSILAGHYASLLEESYSNALTLYPKAKAKVPVIIHNYSMESNGYVTWAPKRMELYPLPGQDNLPLDPAKLLTMHETTHVMQMASLNTGFNRILSTVFGEHIIGLASLEIPSWAFEGDAVYAETRFSESGRGRSNSFMQGAKAISLDKNGIYNYNKMLFGSYRDFTPDHYVFGYAMMNKLRSESPGAWNNAVLYSARHPFFLNPVNLSLRHNEGITKKTLFDVTFDTLAIQWAEAEKNYPAANYPILNPDKKGQYVNYHCPYKVGEGKFIALRSSLSEPQCFVLLDTETGDEKKLSTTGFINPSIFSYSNGSIVWSELHPDPRWDNRDYSVIKTMDTGTGEIKQLTFRSRLSAPALSPDGSGIVAINTTPEMKTSLVFVDPVTGDITHEAEAPDGVILQRPEWKKDGTAVIAVSLTDKGEGVILFDRLSESWKYLLENTSNDIIKAEYSGDCLYVLIQDEKSDNIYLKRGGEKLLRVTNSRLGISSFSIAGDTIIFSDYSSSGFNVCSASINSRDNTSYLTLNELSDHDTLISESDNFSRAPNYVIAPYNKMSHLFNFHSLAPFYFDIDAVQSDPGSVRPGFTLLSQNNLSTLISSVAYEYSNGQNIFHSNITWQGWYPKIEAGISFGGKRSVLKPAGESSYPSDLSSDISLDLNIYLPLYYSYSKFRQIVMPAIYIQYSNGYIYSGDHEFNKSNTLITGRLYLSNAFRTAYRDIYPRWGQVLDFKTTIAPWDKDIYHSIAGVKTTFFTPGFFRNHSIMIQAGLENQKEVKMVFFSNINSFPRGYDNFISEKLSVFSANYTLPLFYPDFSAGSLLYLKRIRTQAFYDIAQSTGTYDFNKGVHYPFKTHFSSFGGELLADFYLLRIPCEFSAGISAGKKVEYGDYFVEGVFSVNIYGSVFGRKR